MSLDAAAATGLAVRRPGSIARDRLWLLAGGLLLYLPGLGLRDPWPADEPRFALIARDMAATGQWLVPQVGGDLYQDKPPVFFWAIGALYALLGDLRVAFLLPSLLAALGSLLLVHDLARRVWSREAGLAAAVLLAVSVQFVLQARAAQIDMLLTFLVTASLYGIGRHLLLGPDWRAYALGGFAAGLGVITKGTGFLALLALLPYAALRRAGFEGLWAGRGARRWWLAPAAALAAIGLWLVPMLLVVALSGDPALAAYRDEILLRQTVERYSAAWAHQAPWYYFILQVIPGLWLPGIALLPWLVPGWRRAIAGRDGRPLLFLGWAVLVVVFFSLSSGKRGVYILPALPAFALAAAPLLPDLWRRQAVQTTLFVLAAAAAGLVAGAAAYLAWFDPGQRAVLEARYGVTSLAPLVVIAAAATVLLALLRPRRGFAAWAAVLAVAVCVTGLWVAPMIDGARSGRDFIRALERAVPAGAELGMVRYREQYLLQLTRPATNFGHRRDERDEQELFDAAAWLGAAPGRVLMVDAAGRARCFGSAAAIGVGESNRKAWYLVSAPAGPDCAARGDPGAVRHYAPPAAARP